MSESHGLQKNDREVRTLKHLWAVRVFMLATPFGSVIHRGIAQIATGRNPADNFWRSGNMLGAIGLATSLIIRFVHKGRSGCERNASAHSRAPGSTQTRSDQPIESAFASMRLLLRSMIGANQREAAAACAGRAAREAAARPPPVEAAPLHPSGFAVAGSRRDEVGKGAVAHPAAPSKPGSTALWPMMLNSSCSGAV